jgi:hypothetical protein
MRYILFVIFTLFGASLGSYAHYELDSLLSLAGFSKENTYCITAAVTQCGIKRTEEDGKKHEGDTYSLSILKKGNVFRGQVQLDNSETSKIMNYFFDGNGIYELKNKSQFLMLYDKYMELSWISLPFDGIEELLDTESKDALEIKQNVKMGSPVEIDRAYSLSNDSISLTVKLHEKDSSSALFFFSFMDEKSKSVYRKVKVEIVEISTALTEELFWPNGFGDRYLTPLGSDFSLFVRDFLPSHEELQVLRSSEEAKREYEADARSRPRVGPIDKYSKPLDLSQYK